MKVVIVLYGSDSSDYNSSSSSNNDSKSEHSNDGQTDDSFPLIMGLGGK